VTARRRLDLTQATADDIADLLDYSAERYGTAARRRYEALIAAGLEDLRSDALRPASADRPELGVRTYHLRHARSRAGSVSGLVSAPRHLLVYELAADDLVRIIRVLHDSMEVERHVARGADDSG
jgi:toxin ParE1/3/4